MVTENVKLEWLVALPGRIALVVVYEFVVRPKTIVRVLAPECPVVAVRDRRVPGGFDKQAFPAQPGAPVLANVGQPGAFTGWLHFYPLARTASSSARFTATRANCTL